VVFLEICHPWQDYETVTRQIYMLRTILLAVKGHYHAQFVVLYPCDSHWGFLRSHTLRHIS